MPQFRLLRGLLNCRAPSSQPQKKYVTTKPKHIKISKLNNLQCEVGAVNNKMLCYDKNIKSEDLITSTK